MDNSIFLLAKDPEHDCRDLIFHRDGKLRVKVVCLDEKPWESNPDELQLYANNMGEKLLFETVDFNQEEPGQVIEAIKWYANYIGNPKMEIGAEEDEV